MGSGGMERDQERGKGTHTHVSLSLSLSLSYIVVVLSGVRQCGEGIKNCEGPLDQSYLWTKCKERETQRHIIGVVVDRTWKPWAVDRPQGDRYRLTPSHYIHHRVTYTYVT